MSDLRDELRQTFIDFAKEYNDIWPSYGTYSQFLGRKGICEDRHITQAITAFKTHIEGCKPKNPYPNQYITDIGATTYTVDREQDAGRIGFAECIEEYSKALMESLE